MLKREENICIYIEREIERDRDRQRSTNPENCCCIECLHVIIDTSIDTYEFIAKGASPASTEAMWFGSEQEVADLLKRHAQRQLAHMIASIVEPARAAASVCGATVAVNAMHDGRSKYRHDVAGSRVGVSNSSSSGAGIANDNDNDTAKRRHQALVNTARGIALIPKDGRAYQLSAKQRKSIKRHVRALTGPSWRQAISAFMAEQTPTETIEHLFADMEADALIQQRVIQVILVFVLFVLLLYVQ